jgi:hypothetical protein
MFVMPFRFSLADRTANPSTKQLLNHAAELEPFLTAYRSAIGFKRMWLGRNTLLLREL